MSIDKMISLIFGDIEAKRELIALYRSIGKHIPEAALETVEAQERACLILKEVQKLYEKTKKEDFGED